MEIDEVLYSYLMAGSLMILPPIGSSVQVTSSDPNFGSFRALGGDPTGQGGCRFSLTGRATGTGIH